jgi:Stage II sporulation protein E (SpoIIE)
MNPNPALETRVDAQACCPLEIGGATRARRNAAMNGDAFVIERFKGGALIAVVDGLGHGERAFRAAEVAVRCLRSRPEQALDVVFRGVAKACHSTDGVVMAAARFEFANGVAFEFASIGNIEARLFVAASIPDLAPRTETLMVRRGILGANAVDPYVTRHSWPAGSALVLHSDGVVSRWGIAEFRDVRYETASAMADAMLGRLAKEDDDATLVVVRDIASP